LNAFQGLAAIKEDFVKNEDEAGTSKLEKSITESNAAKNLGKRPVVETSKKGKLPVKRSKKDMW